MVTISKRIAPLTINVNLSHDKYYIISDDSGVGKSFYSRLICDILNKEGKMSQCIQYDYLVMLDAMLKRGYKYNLIVIDEYELYCDKIDLRKIESISDNIWVIGRVYFNEKNYHLAEYMISKNEVTLSECENYF